MKIVFTKHVHDKLKTKESTDLGIKLKTLEGILKNPTIVDKSVDPQQTVGKLTQNLSLSIIWKVDGGIIKVITFYPARKGRYESKILRRR